LLTNREILINRYKEYSVKQLLEVYHNLTDYSEDAKEALRIVIQDRGGLDLLLENEQSNAEEIAETDRIKAEIKKLITPGMDLDFLSKLITSQKFDQSRTDTIIQETFAEINKDLDDRKVKPRTIIGGIIAAGIASLAGGILWGLQMMWSGRAFAIFFLGLVFLCYGLVRLVTRQSYKNMAVFLFTALSVIMALLIGQLMYVVFGKQ